MAIKYTFIIFSTESHLLKNLSHTVMSFATPVGTTPVTNNALNADYSHQCLNAFQKGAA